MCCTVTILALSYSQDWLHLFLDSMSCSFFLIFIFLDMQFHIWVLISFLHEKILCSLFARWFSRERTWGIAQRVSQAAVAKPGNPSWTSRVHLMEGEKGPQELSSDLHVGAATRCLHTHPTYSYTQDKSTQCNRIKKKLNCFFYLLMTGF